MILTAAVVDGVEWKRSILPKFRESTAFVFTVEDLAKRKNIYGKTTGVGNLLKAVETGNP